MGTNSGATTGINNKPAGGGTGSGGGGVIGTGLSGSVGLGGSSSGGGVGGIVNAANSLGPNTGLGLVSGNNVSNAGGMGVGPVGNTDDGNGGTSIANNQQSTPQYTIPGILHFIQHEWSRFELERSQWDVDRAELQVCIYSNFYFFS